jgi:hypothetical protein
VGPLNGRTDVSGVAIEPRIIPIHTFPSKRRVGARCATSTNHLSVFENFAFGCRSLFRGDESFGNGSG